MEGRSPSVARNPIKRQQCSWPGLRFQTSVPALSFARESSADPVLHSVYAFHIHRNVPGSRVTIGATGGSRVMQ